MRNDRKKKIMTLSILVAAVLLVSIGFAAFSATLKISSGMMVNPDESDFKVVFSSNENTLETNPIKANPSNFGDDATINNATQPTISGLNTYFTNPGDSVTYTFFVRNEGEYEAFLNSISFRGKKCTPEEGTNESMVNSACMAITTTVSVGSITASETLTDITGESLIPGQSKQVTVTISYDPNGARANGPFTVEYGDITMYYDATPGINEEAQICYVTYDRNSNQKIDSGDEVTCGTETFYVIPNDPVAHPTATGNNITLLTHYNLDVGNVYENSKYTPISNPTGIQSRKANEYNYGVLAFAETAYWGSVAPGTFVYNSNSLLYPHVENYKTYLKSMVGVNVKEASLATYNQYQSIKSYINNTNFWLGTFAEVFSNEWVTQEQLYAGTSNGTVSFYSFENYYGVRPIIVVSLSDIKITN